MSKLLNTCPNLQADCDRLLQLLNAQPELRSFDITPVQPSLRKAVSPTLEIVFAGPFSAGKSMLISDISRYLGEEKYPQLLEQLVSDLQNVCINLSNLYQPEPHELKQQPNDIEALKPTKLLELSQELKAASLP